MHLPCAQDTDPVFQDTFSPAVINNDMYAKVSKPNTEQGRNEAWLVRKEMSGDWIHGGNQSFLERLIYTLKAEVEFGWMDRREKVIPGEGGGQSENWSERLDVRGKMAALGRHLIELARLVGLWGPKSIAQSWRSSNVEMKWRNLIQEDQGSHQWLLNREPTCREEGSLKS